MKSVMIAVDGSKMADKVLLKGRMVAETCGCDVMIFTVVKKFIPVSLTLFYISLTISE